jgi:hypothetical protein
VASHLYDLEKEFEMSLPVGEKDLGFKHCMHSLKLLYDLEEEEDVS